MKLKFWMEEMKQLQKMEQHLLKKIKFLLTGAIIRYIKNKSLLIINEGKIKKIDDNLKINSKVIEYNIDQSNLYLKNNVKINDISNNIKIILMK